MISAFSVSPAHANHPPSDDPCPGIEDASAQIAVRHWSRLGFLADAHAAMGLEGFEARRSWQLALNACGNANKIALTSVEIDTMR